VTQLKSGTPFFRDVNPKVKFEMTAAPWVHLSFGHPKKPKKSSPNKVEEEQTMTLSAK
jgi:hypothetical protein